MLPLRFIDRVKFFIERQFVKGAFFQLMVVAVFIGLISLLGGVLVAWLGGQFDDLGSAVWWAFLRLTDPGYLGDDQGSWQRLISTLLTVSGYVVFLGALVAIMTRWLIALMNNLEEGLTPVSLRNHIAVLGWTSRTLPLLARLLGTSGRMRLFLRRHDAHRLRLAVLADRVSADQLHRLRHEPGIGRKAKQVVLRSGSPLQPEALRRVACLDAAALIVPSGSQEAGSVFTSDMETVKALLSIAAQAREFRRPLPFAVAELQDLRRQKVLERAYPGELEVIASDAVISRLLVQNLLHPGLSELFRELMVEQDGNELYVRSGADLAGYTLGEVMAHCPEAIVLGLLWREAGEWQVRLNAGAGQLVGPDDWVVMLARDFKDTRPQRWPVLTPPERSVPATPTMRHSTEPRRVLVLGWNGRVPALVHELGRYRGINATVDIVSILPPDERERAIHRYAAMPSQLRCRQIEADYLVEEELRVMEPERYDSIFLLSSDRLGTGEEADARAMVGYLQLEAMLSTAGERPQVIMELIDPNNESLLSANDSEVILSPVIMSHLLAQVAIRREIRLVHDELFTPGGSEFLFRAPGEFDIPAGADFATLEQVAATHGEIALGVHRARADNGGKRLMLNPGRGTPLDLQVGDRLVLLGTS